VGGLHRKAMTKHSQSNGKITIMIVEDHLMVSESWTLFLSQENNFQIIALCKSGEEAVAMTEKVKPDIILMDISLPGINGIEATKIICSNAPTIRVIGISLYTHISYAKQMMRNGAAGYLTKTSELSEMLSAIETVYKGKMYLCKELQTEIVSSSFTPNSTESKIALLTEREIEVIHFIRQGFFSREIAVALGITVKTVNAHRSKILKKLELKNAAELVQFIHKHPTATTLSRIHTTKKITNKNIFRDI
jgi:DNA-binding NarL/FixJ family response regulator